MGKPDCYDCKFRRNLPGDAHSCCVHPAIGGDSGDLIMGLATLLSGGFNDAIKKLNIAADPHGVRSGWFLWPANFDPVWLQNCDGFEDKNVKSEDKENENTSEDVRDKQLIDT